MKSLICVAFGITFCCICLLGPGFDLRMSQAGASTAPVADLPRYYRTYVVNPVSATEILPTSPLQATPKNTIKVHACKDQYQSASFVIRAEQNLANFLAIPGNLSDGTHIIPGDAVDIRVVKCWYQSGVRESNVRQAGVRNLVPELLLKDDGLVRVDNVTQQNYLRLSGGGELSISGDIQNNPELIQPTDAAILQPVSIIANINKQFWVTLHVPPNAVAGTYKGRIFLTSDASPPDFIDLKLLVHPFTLEQPNIIYGMFYEGQTNSLYPQGTINAGWKSVVQLTAELSNMLQHGIRYPGLTQYYGDPHCNPNVNLDIRDILKFPKDCLFYLTGMGANPPRSQLQLDAWRNKLKTIKTIAKKYGYAKVYCFGVDEGEEEILKQEIPAFRITHEESCLNFITTNINHHPFELVGNYVDVATYAWKLNTAETAKWHSVGGKIFSYANPQTANENPYIYRCNCGLNLFENKYDGAFIYAYQGNHGQHIWNDFAGIPVGKGYRGHNLTYPTTNGVIDAVQYEGLREGINDMRYIATLQKAIKDYKDSKPDLAAVAETWINDVNPDDDLDVLRLKMVEWINMLKK